MSFTFNINTRINSQINTAPVINAVNILKRDIKKVFNSSNTDGGEIELLYDKTIEEESYIIKIRNRIEIHASDDLGFVYALLCISEKYLCIKPFWFWLDQKIEKHNSIVIDEGEIKSPVPAVRYRGWFFNDEVLLNKWTIEGDNCKVWEMAFEALLRCGGNTVIPGTDKNSRINRELADKMGLWITHHHAEPLGAEMFSRAYPNTAPNFLECEELFYNLWEDAVKEQSGYKVIWNLCFRGQGDNPFWNSDTSGKFDTEEKRGALISSLIRKQCDIVRKYIKNPVFCTNLYGEIMELYDKGYIDLDDDIIKVKADNGYGKMVTRRRDNHDVRVSSMPVQGGGRQGIYYHVSFYDLQAANHITMLPNSVELVNNELGAVLNNDGNDFWIINCSNVKPHTYYLDAVRKKWWGMDINDESHSEEYTRDYYGGDAGAARALREYPHAMIQYGNNEDEHAGEQFYTENVRIIAHNIIRGESGNLRALNWIAKGDLYEQTEQLNAIVSNGLSGLREYFTLCGMISSGLEGDLKNLFDDTVFVQSKIHFYCASAVQIFCNAVAEIKNGNYKQAFLLAGDSAVMFDTANAAMRLSERGIWKDFYENDCFADIKHSAYMARKMMGTIRELGDNARHDKWYRDAVYAEEDKNIYLQLVLDNHMTDDELYNAMKEKTE